MLTGWSLTSNSGHDTRMRQWRSRRWNSSRSQQPHHHLQIMQAQQMRRMRSLTGQLSSGSSSHSDSWTVEHVMSGGNCTACGRCGWRQGHYWKRKRTWNRLTCTTRRMYPMRELVWIQWRIMPRRIHLLKSHKRFCHVIKRLYSYTSNTYSFWRERYFFYTELGVAPSHATIIRARIPQRK